MTSMETEKTSAEITAETQVAKIFEWRRGFNAMHLIDLGVRLGLFRRLQINRMLLRLKSLQDWGCTHRMSKLGAQPHIRLDFLKELKSAAFDWHPS